MAGMRHTMIWIKIIDYQLENSSEKQLKQSPDNFKTIIIAGMAHCK